MDKQEFEKKYMKELIDNLTEGAYDKGSVQDYQSLKGKTIKKVEFRDNRIGFWLTPGFIFLGFDIDDATLDNVYKGK